MTYDVAIIGGGPAGLMAAGRAAETGARVIIIEKNKQLGVKLLLTGGGRCNITNLIEQPKSLATAYHESGKFLLSAFSRFGPVETLDFFERRGVKTKVEANARVFPKSNSAKDILQALVNYSAEFGVEIKTGAVVKEMICNSDRIVAVKLLNNEEISADNIILCVGGKSYPATGSTGEGYKWLKQLGHSLTEIKPALTPLIVKEKFLAELQGLSLTDCKIGLYSASRKISSRRGEIIFTSNGLSGPLALDLSHEIGRLPLGNVIIKIDFKPDESVSQLEEKMLAIFRADNNKEIKNSLLKILPPKLIPIILRLSATPAGKKVNSVTKEERKKNIELIKIFTLEIKGLAGYDSAMITSGGVNLKEVDQRTMRSKLVNNLFLAGEILGIDGPTGGYNLQVCWSSGYVAGENAGKKA